MTDPGSDIDTILSEQLANLAEGAAPESGGLAARSSAWTAKRLKTQSAAQEQVFEPHRGRELVNLLAQTLDCTPEYHQPDQQTGPATLRGVIGSGFGGMNPSYVRAVVDLNQGRLAIAAYAKEGLINQDTAQKAIRKLLAELPLT